MNLQMDRVHGLIICRPSDTLLFSYFDAPFLSVSNNCGLLSVTDFCFASSLVTQSALPRVVQTTVFSCSARYINAAVAITGEVDDDDVLRFTTNPSAERDVGDDRPCRT